MRFLPKVARRSKGVNLQIFPPRPFITGLVQLPMMHAAEWYSELITDFETNCPRLRKPQVMRIGGLPSTVRRSLENAGVEFIEENGGGPGVRLRKRYRSKKV